MKNSTTMMFVFWLCLIADIFVGNFRDPSQPAGAYDVFLTILMAVLLFGWFSADARDINVRPSAFLKVAIVALSAVAVPYYLIRYKGWKRALKSFGIFAGFLLIYFAIALVAGLVN